jgi:hypothetical protein
VQTSNSLTRVYGPPTLTILGTIEALTKGSVGLFFDCNGGDGDLQSCGSPGGPK